MRENEKVQGVDIALDLLNHEVDLFNAVTKHLKELDFHSITRKNPFVREKLIKASNKAFAEHTKNILDGRTQRYANDVLLTDKHIYFLTDLDESLINAYARSGKSIAGGTRLGGSSVETCHRHNGQ